MGDAPEAGRVVSVLETREHILLTVLGTNPIAASYTLDGRCAESRFAPVALLNLLQDEARPDRVIALCTPEAKRESWPLLQEELRSTACAVERVAVPSGYTQASVNEYLLAVCKRVSERGSVDLTVDLTHGFRHFSFLAYTAVLYLEALGIARVRGAHYGVFGGPGDQPNTFFDLRPLLELPRWVYALRVLRDTGSALPLAEALATGSDHPSIRQLDKCLKDLSKAYHSGLPLELGRHARDILRQSLRPLGRRLSGDHRLPLTNELVRRFEDTLRKFALPDDPVAGGGWKAKVELSRGELTRQGAIIDDLLQRGSIATALGMMDEWTVSWAVWRLESGAGWLDFHGSRGRAASLLGAIGAVYRDSELKVLLSDEQCRLGKFWNGLSETRNAYAHHGMRKQDLLGQQTALQERRITEVWGELKMFPDWSLTFGDVGERVLVSPVGRRPGVLFSALEACRAAADDAEPTICLAICSPETEVLVEQAANHARFAGRIEAVRIDPHGGHGEIQAAVKAGRRHLVGADDVFVNVTGGTTVMGLAAEALAAEARRFARPVRRFGLIDRRPPAEQDADPYQVGEPFWLDGEGAEDADAN